MKPLDVLKRYIYLKKNFYNRYIYRVILKRLYRVKKRCVKKRQLLLPLLKWHGVGMYMCGWLAWLRLCPSSATKHETPDEFISSPGVAVLVVVVDCLGMGVDLVLRCLTSCHHLLQPDVVRHSAVQPVDSPVPWSSQHRCRSLPWPPRLLRFGSDARP